MQRTKALIQLTWVDTFLEPRPSPGSKTRRLQEQFPQTVRIWGFYSWFKTRKAHFSLVTFSNIIPWSKLPYILTQASLFSMTYFIPCWKTEFLLVLQMIRSAHCTTTMLVKKAVWQVNSTIFLCSYVWNYNKNKMWAQPVEINNQSCLTWAKLC